MDRLKMDRLKEQIEKDSEAKWFERGKALHGAERWELIELALRQPVSQAALVNGFLPLEVQTAVCESQQLTDHEDIDIDLACECPAQPSTDRKATEFRVAASILDTDDGAPPRPAAALRSAVQPSLPLMPCCFMSVASMLAAQVVGVEPGDIVLDLCAAPGAKALVLASLLFGAASVKERLPDSSAEDAANAEAESAVGAETGCDGAAEITTPVDRPEEIETAVETTRVPAPMADEPAQKADVATVAKLPQAVSSAARSKPASIKAGKLVCNEPDRSRGMLLKDVLESFLPEELVGKRGRVVVTSCEATRNGKVPPAWKAHAPYDKILVDAPCSHLRRLAKQPRAKISGFRGEVTSGGEAGNPEDVKRNAERALELLRCAAALIKPGGLIVYCVTSLEEMETDGVVAKLLRGAAGELAVEPGEDDVPVGGAETTAYGTIVIPDQGTLHGPLYLARIRREPP